MLYWFLLLLFSLVLPYNPQDFRTCETSSFCTRHLESQTNTTLIFKSVSIKDNIYLDFKMVSKYTHINKALTDISDDWGVRGCRLSGDGEHGTDRKRSRIPATDDGRRPIGRHRHRVRLGCQPHFNCHHYRGRLDRQLGSEHVQQHRRRPLTGSQPQRPCTVGDSDGTAWRIAPAAIIVCPGRR